MRHETYYGDKADIHPELAQISATSNEVYTRELVNYLASIDEGKKSTRHKSSIKEIQRFHNRYALGASAQGINVEPSLRHSDVETPCTEEGGKSGLLLAETVVFLLFLCVAFLLYIIFYPVFGG